MWSSRPYTFDRVVRIFFTAIVAAALLFLAYYLRHVLLPFAVACLVAYLIEPWVRLNQKWLKIKKHSWAVILSTVEALIVCAALFFILLPIVEREFSQLAVILKHYLNDDSTSFGQITGYIHNFFHTHFDTDKLIAEIEKINENHLIEGIWHGLTHGLDKILGTLSWLISIVYVIFILLDFDKYKNGIRKYIPEKYKPAVAAVGHDVSWTMKEYFRNQALISLIVGVCYGIGFSIVGIPMAVVIGLINIILFMIPYMVYLSLIPVTLMCLFKSMETGMDFWIIWLECLSVYVFVECFSDLFLTPKIMGKALGLNPAIILLSLSVWGSLLGLLGMLIALPATTIIIKWTKISLGSWRDKLNSQTPEFPPPPPNSPGSDSVP